MKTFEFSWKGFEESKNYKRFRINKTLVLTILASSTPAFLNIVSKVQL